MKMKDVQNILKKTNCPRCFEKYSLRLAAFSMSFREHLVYSHSCECAECLSVFKIEIEQTNIVTKTNKVIEPITSSQSSLNVEPGETYNFKRVA